MAGREIIETDGELSFGKWVRPVSAGNEGGLSIRDCQFRNGLSPRVLDVVDIPLQSHEPTDCQPENWLIDESKYWKKVQLDETPIPIVDKPRGLWLGPISPRDRVTPAELGALGLNRSLYLVQVTNFRIELTNNTYDGKPRRRALFRYNNLDYDFSLTDVALIDKLCTPHPPIRRIVRLESGGDCFLCVSLTPIFNGYHYKIAAAVIEDIENG